MFLGLITLYVVCLTLLRMIYLLFKPKFLSEQRFGAPPKYLMVMYYLYMSFTATVFALHRLNIITYEMPRQITSDIFRPPYPDSFYWIIGTGIILATIHTIFAERYLRRKGKENSAN